MEQAFERNEADYGRKLYLIENCIYGVDIQPIAVQIAKLRCFISLIVDQRVDDKRANRGVLALPNLETKFVAANTLIGIDRPRDGATIEQAIEPLSPKLIVKCNELLETLRQYIVARQPITRAQYLEQGKEICIELNHAFKNRADFEPLNANWIFSTARSVKELEDRLPFQQENLAGQDDLLRSEEIIAKERELEKVRRDHFAARTRSRKLQCRDKDRKLREEIGKLLKRDGFSPETTEESGKLEPLRPKRNTLDFLILNGCLELKAALMW